ncbi:DUF1569 domain-containing protein [Flavobacterium psychrotolerans]|uniref:DUF1569 domain-containing protein n=1 Tax=Flavobacterium psychrotolerans TaxID=2169410 RepID=A0A2U1JQ76_9FLAO|nr:DUF1569 domain-containing protein [Flavobacterium psychrotolerans]PWA07336.1 hypothetical protein DB895_01025 [Flavobacterium psychrotolerans]
MNSIFDSAGNEAMIVRINKLIPESQPLWGKMSVDQMLKHTDAAVEVAFGTKQLKINFLMKFLGKMLKNKVFNSEFKKNSPTAPEFIFSDKYDFETSKKDLIEKFSRFAQGHQSIKIMKHPFWGAMNYDEWDLLMWKHLDHHLKQFGV